MTISNLPLRIPVHFQPIKPTSDLQVIFEWTIYTKHTLSSPVTLNISISVARLTLRRRDIKVTLLIIRHGQLRRLESLMLEMPQALINAMQARTASTNSNPSPQWPRTTFGVGWRSNSPDTISHSACAAVSDENTPPLPTLSRLGSRSSRTRADGPFIQVTDVVHAAAARVGVAVQHDARAVEVVHASVSTRRSRRRRSARCARLCGRPHATWC